MMALYLNKNVFHIGTKKGKKKKEVAWDLVCVPFVLSDLNSYKISNFFSTLIKYLGLTLLQII